MNVARRTPLVLAFVISVFAWAALTYPGYFELEHGFRPLFNLTDLARNLPAVGWAPTVGQPFDLLRGEGALPYWLALIPRALAGSSAAAMRWTLAIGLMAAAIGMYGWTRRRLGEWPGLIAAGIYVLWPVGLATVYHRGAPAEALFLAAMPWVLWAAERATARPADADLSTCRASGRVPGTWFAAAALIVGLAALIWTQAGLALWFAGILAGYTATVKPNPPTPFPARERGKVRPSPRRGGVEGEVGRKRGDATLWPIAAGLALGFAGLVPVALRHGLAGTTYVAFLDHLISPYLLLLAGGNGPAGRPVFQLGLIAYGLAALGALRAGGAGAHGSRATFAASCLPFYVLAVILPVFLASTLAAPIWRLVPFLQGTLTYPWQLLLLAGPWLAWLAGAGAKVLLAQLPTDRRDRATPVVVACVLTMILLGSYHEIRPAAAPVAPAEAPPAIFGDNEIALLAASATVIPPTPAGAPALQAGATISVTVYWQALRPLPRDYTVFLHLTDPTGQLQGQQDTMPLNNQLPTTRWRSGQIVADQYHATLKPGAPAGEDYRIYLGWYLWQTGERLRTGTDDKVILKP